MSRTPSQDRGRPPRTDAPALSHTRARSEDNRDVGWTVDYRDTWLSEWGPGGILLADYEGQAYALVDEDGNRYTGRPASWQHARIRTGRPRPSRDGTDQVLPVREVLPGLAPPTPVRARSSTAPGRSASVGAPRLNRRTAFHNAATAAMNARSRGLDPAPWLRRVLQRVKDSSQGRGTGDTAQNTLPSVLNSVLPIVNETLRRR